MGLCQWTVTRGRLGPSLLKARCHPVQGTGHYPAPQAESDARHTRAARRVVTDLAPEKMLHTSASA